MKKNKQGKGTPEIEKKATYSQPGIMRGFSVYNAEGDTYYKAEVERVATELRAELYPAPKAEFSYEKQPVATTERKSKPAPKQKSAKRKFPLVLILILNLIALFVIVLPTFDLGFTTTFAPFVKATEGGQRIGVSLLDGILAKFGSMLGLSSQLDYTAHADGLTDIVLLVFVALALIVTVLSLVQVIKSIVALADKKEKKQKHFGGVAFWTLAGILFILAAVIFLKAQFGFGDFCSLLLPEQLGDYGLKMVGEGYVLYGGYGLYALIAVQLLTMIFSACVYGKEK